MTRHRSYPKRAAGVRSGLERALSAQLDALGVSYKYEPFHIPFEMPKSYLPDYQLPNGIIIEAKGYFTSADRTKMRLVKKCFPDLDLRLVFSRATNKLSKKSTTTYAMWCIDHGFRYATGFIPPEWLAEPPNKKSLEAIKRLTK